MEPFSSTPNRLASVAVPFPSAYFGQVPESPAITPDAPYLAGLNPPQREAVLTTEGPVLVLAGAGTGKTAALTARLAHLIATRRAWPSQILAVTFTNKAAREMKERLHGIIGAPDVSQLAVGTFHSICARWLRIEGKHLGLDPNFAIYDSDGAAVSGRFSTGLFRLATSVPWYAAGKKLLLHSGAPCAGWLGLMTRNPGRSWFSLPSP